MACAPSVDVKSGITLLFTKTVANPTSAVEVVSSSPDEIQSLDLLATASNKLIEAMDPQDLPMELLHPTVHHQPPVHLLLLLHNRVRPTYHLVLPLRN